jgi:DNA-binding NtrC family response regulator
METESNFPVLIIDDEPQYLQSAAVSLRVAGYNVITLQDPGLAIETVKNRIFGAILIDILMPEIRGDLLIEKLIPQSPLSAIIMVTAVNDVETAVNCMRKGAFDYMVKPVEKDRLVTTVKRAIEMVELKTENRRLKDILIKGQLKHPENFEKIVTRDPHLLSTFKYIEAIAPTPMPVLIRGETGTGKELIAHAIHRNSGRKGEFVCVNAAGMTESFFNDALFGHEKGAFTGAEGKRAGLVARASGGTLFLDEIGDMAMESQINILRFLEQRTYYPAGSDTPRTSDTRIIAATNRDLDSMRNEGTFRNDLYYRLEAHVIDIPPLRQHSSDIPLLIDHFVEIVSHQLNKNITDIKRDFYNACLQYHFPGNVRELRNIVSDAISIADGAYIDSSMLPEKLTKSNIDGAYSISSKFNRELLEGLEYLPALKDMEQMLVDEALRRSNGNQTIAARIMGMTRSALNKRLIRAQQA